MKAICAATRGLPLSQFLKCVVSVFLEFQPQCSLSKSTFTTLCWNLSTQDFFFLDYGVICSWWESCPYMCCDATLGVILPSEKPADSELTKKKSYATYYIWHQRKEKGPTMCSMICCLSVILDFSRLVQIIPDGSHLNYPNTESSFCMPSCLFFLVHL